MSSYYEKFLATGEVKCIDEEIPFEVPKGWEWCRLRDVIYPPKYGTSSKSLSNGDVPVLRMGNIQDGEVVYDKLVFSNNVEDNRKYLLQDGDLLFNRTNSAELVGKTAIFKGNRHVIYAGYLILLRPIKTNSEYLNYIFSSPYVRSYCKEVKTIGVQQCNINAEKVSQLLVPIAPFEEQMRIADKIKEVLPSVDKYSISQYDLDLLNVSLSECLKKSILQEAIQGRLVPQIAEEGTAKELLEQIKKEKQKFVKEGKLKKSTLATSVIFRGDDNKYYERIGAEIYDINDTIPFDIPANWNWCRFRGASSIFKDKTFKKEDASTGSKGVRVLRGGNISPFELVMKPDDLFLPYTKIKESMLLRKNDIVTPAVTSLENIGKAARVQKDLNDVTVGGFVFILRSFLCNDWLSQYLLALLGSPSMGEYMKSVTNKSGQAFYNIGKERLAMAMIPLPPIKEQQRIVAQIEILFEQLK